MCVCVCSCVCVCPNIHMPVCRNNLKIDILSFIPSLRADVKKMLSSKLAYFVGNMNKTFHLTLKYSLNVSISSTTYRFIYKSINYFHDLYYFTAGEFFSPTTFTRVRVTASLLRSPGQVSVFTSML